MAGRNAFWSKNDFNAAPEAVFQKVPGFAVDLDTEYAACKAKSAKAACKRPGALLDELQSLERDGKLIIEPDQRIQLNSRRTALSWGLDRIDQRPVSLDGIVDTTSDGAGVAIYVVDSGIRADHEDFGGRVRLGYSAFDDSVGPSDCNGHGTHVAGTAGGSTFGVAPAASLVAVRVVDCTGVGTLSGAITAVDWIVADHAAGAPAVANLSLGTELSQTLNDAVLALINDGITVIAAAGNQSTDACTTSPAAIPEVITVGSSDADDAPTPFSNFGPCVKLYAPGEDILSDGIESTSARAVASGTSNAAPHVAGAAALILAQNTALAPADVAARILTDATPATQNMGAGSPARLLYAGTAANGVPPVAKKQAMTRPRILSARQVGRFVRLAISKGPEGLIEVYRDRHLVMVTAKRVVLAPMGSRPKVTFQVRLRAQNAFSPMSRMASVTRRSV